MTPSPKASNQKTKRRPPPLSLHFSEESASVPVPINNPIPTLIKHLVDEITEKINLLTTVEKAQEILKLTEKKPIITHKRGGEGQFFHMRTYKAKERLYKIYNYNGNTIVEETIVREIAFQKFAESLNDHCKFQTPKILDYGKINNVITNTKLDFDYIMFIEMEFLNYKPLTKAMNHSSCHSISNKINNIEKCMEQNKLYHNDLHQENIFFDEPTGTIGIIDYGEASSHETNFQKRKFDCPMKNSEKTRKTRKSNSRNKHTKEV
jgi:tRNA A-37 threonylcarbamoyl transferase component Bud32